MILDVLLLLLLLLLALPAFVCAAYLFWLAMVARPLPVPAYGEPRMKFDILVPARNKEATIADTVARLRALDYPERLSRVIVVADNCSDKTAQLAEQAGAMVLTQSDKAKRGRGYALALAFDLTMRDGIADGVVIMDPDAEASPNLLRAFAARFEAGAQCVQAACRVKDPDLSKRSRLMVLVLATFRTLRSLSRERLGLSSRASANGVAFSRGILGDVPQDAHSLARDGEYGVRLGMAGFRVFYAHEANVTVVPRPGDDDQLDIAKMHLGALAKTGLKTKSGLLLDLALDLATPPISLLLLATFAGWIVSLAWASHHSALPAYVWGLALYFILFYVVRGWAIAGVGMRGLASFAYAPVYMGQRIGQFFRPAARRGER